MAKKINGDYMRNIMFGAEDSLVSTVGVLFGLAASGQYNTKLLLLAGAVLISVEALSMGVGSYLSETEVHELAKGKGHKDLPWIDGLIMFLTYLSFGIFVIFPYVIAPIAIAKYYSVLATLVALFFLGFIPTKKMKAGMRMLFMAGLAIIVGYIVALVFHQI